MTSFFGNFFVAKNKQFRIASRAGLIPIVDLKRYHHADLDGVTNKLAFAVFGVEDDAISLS